MRAECFAISAIFLSRCWLREVWFLCFMLLSLLSLDVSENCSQCNNLKASSKMLLLFIHCCPQSCPMWPFKHSMMLKRVAAIWYTHCTLSEFNTRMLHHCSKANKYHKAIFTCMRMIFLVYIIYSTNRMKILELPHRTIIHGSGLMHKKILIYEILKFGDLSNFKDIRMDGV